MLVNSSLTADQQFREALMRQAMLLFFAIITIAGCGVDDQAKKGLAREVRDMVRNVESESKGFGAEQQQVEEFIERRTEEFAGLKAKLQEALGTDKANNFDQFYLQGLIDDLKEKGDDLGFEQAKRQTIKRLGQLKNRIEKL